MVLSICTAFRVTMNEGGCGVLEKAKRKKRDINMKVNSSFMGLVNHEVPRKEVSDRRVWRSQQLRVQAQLHEGRSQDLRHLELAEVLVPGGGEQAEHVAGFDSARATFPLSRRRLGDPHHFQRGDSSQGVVAVLKITTLGSDVNGIKIKTTYACKHTSFTLPESMTKTTSSTVIEVSAIFVERITFLRPGGAGLKIFF